MLLHHAQSVKKIGWSELADDPNRTLVTIPILVVDELGRASLHNGKIASTGEPVRTRAGRALRCVTPLPAGETERPSPWMSEGGSFCGWQVRLLRARQRSAHVERCAALRSPCGPVKGWLQRPAIPRASACILGAACRTP